MSAFRQFSASLLASLFLCSGSIAGEQIELPKVAGMVAGQNSVTVFASLSGEGTRILKANGQRIGSFEMISSDIVAGSVVFQKDGSVYRVWLDDGKVRQLVEEPSKPVSAEGALRLDAIKNLAVSADMKSSDKLDKITQNSLDYLLNKTGLSPEAKEEFIQDIRSGKRKIYVVSDKGISPKDVAEGTFSKAEAAELAIYTKMGDAFRASVPPKNP